MTILDIITSFTMSLLFPCVPVGYVMQYGEMIIKVKGGENLSETHMLVIATWYLIYF